MNKYIIIEINDFRNENKELDILFTSIDSYIKKYFDVFLLLQPHTYLDYMKNQKDINTDEYIDSTSKKYLSGFNNNFMEKLCPYLASEQNLHFIATRTIEFIAHAIINYNINYIYIGIESYIPFLFDSLKYMLSDSTEYINLLQSLLNEKSKNGSPNINITYS